VSLCLVCIFFLFFSLSVCTSSPCTGRFGACLFTGNSVADPHHLDADPDPACHFDANADPDPAFHFDAGPHHLDADADPACHFDADPDLDPACHFDADPVLLVTLMKMRIRILHFDADSDPDPSFRIKAQILEKVLK
jgi:hypothetical protein